jgi:hypothetical protein
VTWTAPDLSSVNNVQNWEVKAAVADAAGQTASGSACSKTLTYTPEISAACQMVTADKDLSNLRIGDTIKFTGYGSLTADPAADAIDKIGFRVYKNNNLVLEQIMDTVRAPEKDTGRQKFWKAEYSYYLSGAGSYSVKIRVHWKSRDIWMM